MKSGSRSIQNDALPWVYTVEGKTVRFNVKDTAEEFTVRFRSVEALNRDLPGFINVLFAVATHYRSKQK